MKCRLCAPARPLRTLKGGSYFLKTPNSTTLTLWEDFPTIQCTGLFAGWASFLMSSVLDTTGQSSMQHCNSTCRRPRRCGKSFCLSKGSTDWNKSGKWYKWNRKKNGHGRLLLSPFTQTLWRCLPNSYTMLCFLPLGSSSGLRQASADAAQCKSYDRVLLGWLSLQEVGGKKNCKGEELGKQKPRIPWRKA